MTEIKNFLLRHASWLVVGAIALLLLSPAIAEIKTILLVTVIECLCLALSGMAVFVYTKIDFTQTIASSNPGLVFLGVHICVGLSVLGVYLAQ